MPEPVIYFAHTDTVPVSTGSCSLCEHRAAMAPGSLCWRCQEYIDERVPAVCMYCTNNSGAIMHAIGRCPLCSYRPLPQDVITHTILCPHSLIACYVCPECVNSEAWSITPCYECGARTRENRIALDCDAVYCPRCWNARAECAFCFTLTALGMLRLDYTTGWYTCHSCIVLGRADHATLCVDCSRPTDNSQGLCTACLDRLRYCEHCNTAVRRGDMATWPGNVRRYLCASCSENLQQCGVCREYYIGTHLGCRAIHNYSYKPEPLFRGIPEADGLPAPLYLGIELETVVHRHNNVESTAKNFLQRVNDPDLLYLKYDGSVNHGFEIVTHPCSFDYWSDEFPFDAIEWLGKERLCASFNERSTGNHIHLSKDAFTEEHLYKFMRWHYRNAGFVKRIAQRSSPHYAAFGRPTLKALKDQAKEKDSPERYVAVNLQNRPTVELRYFRANLRARGLRKNLEFAHASFWYSLWRHERKLSVPDFIDFVESEKKYPNLLSFIQAKNLDPRKGGA